MMSEAQGLTHQALRFLLIQLFHYLTLSEMILDGAPVLSSEYMHTFSPRLFTILTRFFLCGQLMYLLWD